MRAWSLELGDGTPLGFQNTARAMLPALRRSRGGSGPLAAGAEVPELRHPGPLFLRAWRGSGPLAGNRVARSEVSGEWQRLTVLEDCLARFAPPAQQLLKPVPSLGTRSIQSAPACESNGWSPDWGWFSPTPASAQFDGAAASGGPWQERLQQPIENLLMRMPAWLSRPMCALPSLVQTADLWGGMLPLVGLEGSRVGSARELRLGACLRSGVYRGDREVDLCDGAPVRGFFPEPLLQRL